MRRKKKTTLWLDAEVWAEIVREATRRTEREGGERISAASLIRGVLRKVASGWAKKRG